MAGKAQKLAGTSVYFTGQWASLSKGVRAVIAGTAKNYKLVYSVWRCKGLKTLAIFWLEALVEMALTHVWQRRPMYLECIAACTQLSCVSLLPLQKLSLLTVVFPGPALSQTLFMLGPPLIGFKVYLPPSVYLAPSVSFYRCCTYNFET